MKKILTLLAVVLLSGCQSLKDYDVSNTQLGGKAGTLDYCVTVLGNDFVCINSERSNVEPTDVEG